jgi:putative methyltransferase (TIGR04325 family)
MKDILRGLCPPLLLGLIRKLRGTHPHEYGKEFPSWEAASAAAGTYSDDLVNRFRVARSLLNHGIDRRPLFERTPLLWLAMLAGRPLSVVDFGGGTGELGRGMQAAFPDTSYLVVENPTMASMLAGEPGTVKYAPDMPASCDVFFTSGTLQYLPTPYDVLEGGFRSAAVAAVLLRNRFSDRPAFRVQSHALFDNGDGAIPPGFENVTISYPHRTVSEKRIMAIAKANGFLLVSRASDEPYSPALVFLRE